MAGAGAGAGTTMVKPLSMPPGRYSIPVLKYLMTHTRTLPYDTMITVACDFVTIVI